MIFHSVSISASINYGFSIFHLGIMCRDFTTTLRILNKFPHFGAIVIVLLLY